MNILLRERRRENIYICIQQDSVSSIFEGWHSKKLVFEVQEVRRQNLRVYLWFYMKALSVEVCVFGWRPESPRRIAGLFRRCVSWGKKEGKSLFFVTRGRGGSPWWTGCSGSLPSPFRFLAACVGAVPCVCPGRAVWENRRRVSERSWAGLARGDWEGSGPDAGWDRLHLLFHSSVPAAVIPPPRDAAPASSQRSAATQLPLNIFKIKPVWVWGNCLQLVLQKCKRKWLGLFLKNDIL